MSLLTTQMVMNPRGEEALPFCHSRREYDAAKGTFFCAHPQVHIARNLVNAEVCEQCDHWRQAPPEEFRPYFPGSGAGRESPCWFLGEQTGLRDCPSCIGHVRLK